MDALFDRKARRENRFGHKLKELEKFLSAKMERNEKCFACTMET